MFDWVKEYYDIFVEWLKDLLLWIPRKVFSEFLEQLAEIITGIPAPDFMLQAKSLLAQTPPAITWALDLAQFNWGISLCMSAFALRYTYSKIPFFGSK